jgi:hypothetical protein
LKILVSQLCVLLSNATVAYVHSRVLTLVMHWWLTYTAVRLYNSNALVAYVYAICVLIVMHMAYVSSCVHTYIGGLRIPVLQPFPVLQPCAVLAYLNTHSRIGAPMQWWLTLTHPVHPLCTAGRAAMAGGVARRLYD